VKEVREWRERAARETANLPAEEERSAINKIGSELGKKLGLPTYRPEHQRKQAA
jgi:hypothetical protein